jgi:hypothetical protein
MARDDFLSWPFFDDGHRALRRELRHFVGELDGIIIEGDASGDEHATCRRLVKAFGFAMRCTISKFARCA